MLDIIAALVAEALEISGKDVAMERDKLLADQATADARYAATSALDHPEGSTTPINEAYRRAQTRYARLRRDGEKPIQKALAQVLAIDIARQRRDEAETHMRLKDEATDRRLDTGINDAARDFLARLVKHGVHPHYLKQLSAEIVAIIADLIAWKAKDARFIDAENPWRDVLTLYADRVIEKPGKANGTPRSIPGTPVRSRYPGGTEHYMFNEMVRAGWGTPTSLEMSASELPPSPIIFDCSIYPEEEAAVMSAEVDVTEVAVTDRQGVPLGVSSVAWQRVADEYDADPNSMSDLQMEILLCGREATAEKVIWRLTNVAGPTWQGDWAPFIAAAKVAGIAAGITAYRRAAIERRLTKLL